ncbi:MAG: response regulator [Lachnospiraceae bacterium]|nr:response regulator [Lachnospiraceae bacterium]
MKDSQNSPDKQHTLFRASHMLILVSITIASAALALMGAILGWEKWPMIPIFASIIFCWFIHIQQVFTDMQRITIYSVVVMGMIFYYGIHPTSTFDLSVTACFGILLCATTGVKKLISFCVVTFCVTFAYNVITVLSADPGQLDALMVSRIIYHPIIVLVIGWLGRTLIDLWARVLKHSKLEIDHLTEATGRFNEFLTKVSHEIRTPINAVLGLSGIAIERSEDKEQLANLEKIRSAGKRVAEQISDILDYSEIDRQNFAINSEDYMLASVLHDLVMEIRAYHKKEVELIIDVDPTIPAMLRTDISKLKTIIWHLTTNALKFTNEGGVYLRITSTPQEYGINLIFEFSDTGCGMTEDTISKLFDGYYQAHNTYTRSTGGLGLGMAIVNGYVAALGGFLNINSTPGEGTTIRVTIPQQVVDPTGCISVRNPAGLVVGGFLNFEKYYSPMVRDYYNHMVLDIVKGLNVHLHRVDTVENLRRLNSSIRMTHLFVGEKEYKENREYLEELAANLYVTVVASDTGVLPAGSKVHLMEKPFYCFPVAEVLNRNILDDFSDRYMYCHGVRALVVDDEPLNLTVARDILERYDITVSTAGNGPEAIDMCSQDTYDIIFMDHMMPGMDGIETMRRIRSDVLGVWKSVPMVALTANAVSTAREAFRAAGFDGFVAKPIDIMELERVLKLVLPKSVVTFEERPHSRRKSNRPGVLPKDSSSAGQNETTPDNSVSTNEQTAGSDPFDVYAPLRNLGVDIAQGLLYCQNDDEFYRSLLVQFAGEAGDKRVNLEKFFADKNLAEYSILVHALKSTAKMIGAPELSEKARALEEASKAGDLSKVEAGHSDAMNDYKVLTDTILKIFGESEESNGSGDDSTESSDDDALEFTPETSDSDALEFSPAAQEEKQ